jgi:hypothetical protein
MRDASLSSTKTWPRIFAAEPHASVLRWSPADSWHQRSASSRAAGGGGIHSRRPGRGHTRRRCRLRNRSARSGRDEPLDRSPDPVPVTFLDTGAAASDGPPRSVASITAMTRKARGAHPGPSPCQRASGATRPRQPLQESRQPPPSARLTHLAPAALAGYPSRPAGSNVSAARPAPCTEGSGLRPDLAGSLDHGYAALALRDRHEVDLDERWERRPPAPSWQRGPVPGDPGENGTLQARR